MKYLTQALLACGLVLYLASVFLPWFCKGLIGGDTIYYWSFKAEIHPYPYPSFLPAYHVTFFDYWSSYSIGTIIFVSQTSTLLFGLLTLLRVVHRKYELIFLGLTLLFSAVPFGTCILQIFELWRIEFVTGFEIGFWVAALGFSALNRKPANIFDN